VSLGERAARVQVDLTPLRTSRDFRLLFWAGTAFYLGGMVSYVALPYLLYSLPAPTWRSALSGSSNSGLSVRTSITSGGVLCVVGVLATATWLRDFWSYDATPEMHAVRQRAARLALEE